MRNRNLILDVLKISVLILVLLMPYGCKTSKTAKGGAAGAAAGGIIGGIIGSGSDDTAKGAILGAAIGGAAGALIGRYMDKQAEELEEELEDAEVERIGEGIKITFDSGILFPFDSSQLTPGSRENVTELAETLKEYEDTNVLIEGHTDSKGPEEYNLGLTQVAKKDDIAEEMLGDARNTIIQVYAGLLF